VKAGSKTQGRNSAGNGREKAQKVQKGVLELGETLSLFAAIPSAVRSPRFALITALIYAAVLTTSAPAFDPVASATSNYDGWVAEYTSDKSYYNRFGDAKTPLKLRITAVEGDDHAPNANPRQSRPTVYGTAVTAEGVHYFSHSSWSTSGGSHGPLPAARLTRLDELLAKLPDDGKRLPPPDRKLMVEADVNGTRIVRVYDRANAPASVWEILRLINYRIAAYTLELKASSEIDARGLEHGGFLRLVPGGKQLVFTGANQPLQFWDIVTHELVREVRCPGSSAMAIAFSPDGSQAAITDGGDIFVADTGSWQFTRKPWPAPFPCFMPDGRHLLLNTRVRDLRIADTTTWELTDLLAEITPDTVCYLPAPGNKRAVAQLKSGAVILWDVAGRRTVATLRDSGLLLDAAFSPDESQVVVQTDKPPRTGRSESNFKVWDTATGALVHELRPYERDGQERSQGLLWTPDGKYVLAGVMPDLSSSHAVCVFNAETGKHLAMFSGFFRINGVVLLPDSSQLAVGCEDGKIRLWDFKAAMKSVREFEASLPPLATP
jgi:WD40 repeat protein